MKLIKEQEILLKLEKEELTEKIKRRKNLIKNMDTHASLSGSYDESLGDLKTQNVVDHARIRKIDSILKNAQIVEEPPTGKIDIGSNIEIFIDFREDSDFRDDNYLSFTLIEKTVRNESSNDYITIESNIGQAILGKKTGDKFSCLAHNGQQVNGIIMSTGSEKEKSMIKEKVRNEN